jgi:phenylalanine-4-hydroxylase
LKQFIKTKTLESNSLLAKLPEHLKTYIVDQNYSHYTAQDQAVWRYVMRQNQHFLKAVAHEGYLEGLKMTGLQIDSIANMYGMNRILKDIGWAAVAVDGFIPPSAFMEFQAHKVLVIAADIRTIDHLQYTPAPDIIHEAAGHAPFIAIPEYAEYLIKFGEIGSKAKSSEKDYELYEAIRHLSIIKEDPSTQTKDIEEAEIQVEQIQKNMGPPSEMALLRNLHWWTVEYGLIGPLENPKIYGAGLLSSISESVNCLQPGVKKIPYTLDAMYCNFDITKPQPQLFVAPDFKHLTSVLEQFAETMVFRKEGKTETNNISIDWTPPTSLPLKEKTHHIEYDATSKGLHALYQHVRDCREQKTVSSLPEIAESLLTKYPKDWLLALEILELLVKNSIYPDTAQKLKQNLEARAKKDVPSELIQNGFNLIYSTFTGS